MARFQAARRSFLGLILLAAAARADGERTISGVVRDAEGKPASGVAVVLEIGRARLQLTEDFDAWESVRTDRTTSGTDGGFKFEDVPAGASLLAWAKTESAFASAPGTESVTLTLAPTGSVAGKATGKPALLKGLRVVVFGGSGLASASGPVDADTGRFAVGGLVPGEGRVRVYRNNFELVRTDVEIVAGEEAKLKAVRIPETFLPAPDPLVDVLKVRLVDSAGHPVRGVQLVWSSQWMDGGMDSDEDGIVRLAGGGVAIGAPPYRLRLANLRQGTTVFRGAVKGGGKGGLATVEIQSLSEVNGTVSLAGQALSLYRLYAVADGKTPRVRPATLEKGRFSVHLPEGPCRIVILTVDGILHETTIDVVPSGAPQTRDVVLP